MSIQVAHPSVRMKGTETDWTPAHCAESECMHTVNKASHYHCPFCSKTVVFTDEVILKAHYRVKHCDKGIDFAGLAILRCCRACKLQGIINQSKNFKGAHWHCYHCGNGFNRRDEALKHYRQHFRNPLKTLQLVIAQDVNQPNTSSVSACTQPLPASDISQSIEQPESATAYRHTDEDSQATSAVQHKVVGKTENTEEAIVLIELPNEQPDTEDSMIDREVCYTDDGALTLNLLQEKERLEAQLKEERLRFARQELKMKGTIETLRIKVEFLSNSNEKLKHQLETLHMSSLGCLLNDNDHQAILDELVQHMSEEHVQLLQHHLVQLRRYTEAVWSTTDSVSSSDQEATEEAVITEPTPEDGVLVTVSSEKARSERTEDNGKPTPREDVQTKQLVSDVALAVKSEGSGMANIVPCKITKVQMTSDCADQVASTSHMISGDVRIKSSGDAHRLSVSGLPRDDDTTTASEPMRIDDPCQTDVSGDQARNSTTNKTFKIMSRRVVKTLKKVFEVDTPSRGPPSKRRCPVSESATAS